MKRDHLKDLVYHVLLIWVSLWFSPRSGDRDSPFQNRQRSPWGREQQVAELDRQFRLEIVTPHHFLLVEVKNVILTRLTND
jgi:hypothetical protein